MARPPQISALAEALGDAGRLAAEVSEDLLGSLVLLGDRPSQDAVDGLVDGVAGVLREASASTQEIALGLSAISARGAGPTSGPQEPATEVGRAVDAEPGGAR